MPSANTTRSADRGTKPQGRETNLMTHTATMAPEPQRLRALERANEVRLARAELKRRIAEGEVSAAEVILACPQEASSWSVREVLMSQHRWGKERCRKFLERNGIHELKRVGQLTDRQKQVLARELEHVCAGAGVLVSERRVLQPV